MASEPHPAWQPTIFLQGCAGDIVPARCGFAAVEELSPDDRCRRRHRRSRAVLVETSARLLRELAAPRPA